MCFCLGLVELTVALRPNMDSNITDEDGGPCKDRLKADPGEFRIGGLEFYSCMLNGKGLPLNECGHYFAYLKEIDGYAACQPFQDTKNHGRIEFSTCALMRKNYVQGYKPRPAPIPCGDKDDPIKTMTQRLRDLAQPKCKKVLCRIAQEGSWKTMGSGKDKDWPKKAGAMDSGYKVTAEKKCTVKYEGMQLIDIDKLFDNLVTQDAKGRAQLRLSNAVQRRHDSAGLARGRYDRQGPTALEQTGRAQLRLSNAVQRRHDDRRVSHSLTMSQAVSDLGSQSFDPMWEEARADACDCVGPDWFFQSPVSLPAIWSTKSEWPRGANVYVAMPCHAQQNKQSLSCDDALQAWPTGVLAEQERKEAEQEAVVLKKFLGVGLGPVASCLSRGSEEHVDEASAFQHSDFISWSIVMGAEKEISELNDRVGQLQTQNAYLASRQSDAYLVSWVVELGPRLLGGFKLASFEFQIFRIESKKESTELFSRRTWGLALPKLAEQEGQVLEDCEDCLRLPQYALRGEASTLDCLPGIDGQEEEKASLKARLRDEIDSFEEKAISDESFMNYEEFSGSQTLLKGQMNRQKGATALSKRLPPLSQTWYSSPAPYTEDVRTKRKLLPKLLAKVVGPLASDATPRTPRAWRSNGDDATERLSRPKSCPDLKRSTHGAHGGRRDTGIAAWHRSRVTQIFGGEAAPKHQMPLGTVHFSGEGGVRRRLGKSVEALTLGFAVGVEPPAATLPPKSDETKPRRVVSMERIRALAEPKRKKPWKVSSTSISTDAEPDDAVPQAPEAAPEAVPEAVPAAGKTSVLALTVYRDEIDDDVWPQIVKSPVKVVFGILKSQGLDLRPTTSPWGRSWRADAVKTLPETSTSLQFFIRTPVAQVKECLRLSGLKGVYAVLKTEERRTDTAYAVVWLDLPLRELRVSAASLKTSMGLVRINKTSKISRGIRFHADDFDEPYKQLKPAAIPATHISVKAVAKLSPTPVGATFESVTGQSTSLGSRSSVFYVYSCLDVCLRHRAKAKAAPASTLAAPGTLETPGATSPSASAVISPVSAKTEKSVAFDTRSPKSGTSATPTSHAKTERSGRSAASKAKTEQSEYVSNFEDVTPTSNAKTEKSEAKTEPSEYDFEEATPTSHAKTEKSAAATEKSGASRAKTEQSEYVSNFEDATPTSNAKTEKSGAKTERSEYEFEEATPTSHAKTEKSAAATEKSAASRAKTEQSEYVSNFEDATPTSNAKTEKSGAKTERSEYEFDEATPTSHAKTEKSAAATEKSAASRAKTEQSEYVSNFEDATPTSNAKTEKSGAKTERSEYDFEEATPTSHAKTEKSAAATEKSAASRAKTEQSEHVSNFEDATPTSNAKTEKSGAKTERSEYEFEEATPTSHAKTEKSAAATEKSAASRAKTEQSEHVSNFEDATPTSNAKTENSGAKTEPSEYEFEEATPTSHVKTEKSAAATEKSGVGRDPLLRVQTEQSEYGFEEATPTSNAKTEKSGAPRTEHSEYDDFEEETPTSHSASDFEASPTNNAGK
ncbi:unnamed protein product [Cladocopium goreaui]|uniref:Repetin n=1 Tax=Cladocopium goreaui TaxID=2562237 RepID=A0A9P1FF24_9DINO|nr:unnamed protein product [Cladocopium goreaui]